MDLPPWPKDNPDVWYMRISREEHQELVELLKPKETSVDPRFCPFCSDPLFTLRWCRGCYFPGTHQHETCSGCGTKFVGRDAPPFEGVSPTAKSDPPNPQDPPV